MRCLWQWSDILNDLDTDALNIVDTTFRTSPVFVVCVATEEGKFLLSRQGEAEDCFSFTPPTDGFDDHSVGRFNQLVVTSPELMDFVMETVAKSDAA